MAYGDDEQRRHAEKDAVPCIVISVSRHYWPSHYSPRGCRLRKVICSLSRSRKDFLLTRRMFCRPKSAYVFRRD